MKSKEEVNLQLNVDVTENATILTFNNYQLEEKYHDKDWTSNDLKTIEKNIHQNIPEENFVRPFEISSTENAPVMEKLWSKKFNSAFSLMTHQAFQKHQGIKIRPDDIHLLIIQGIARFLQEYSEDFRDTFVSFKGRKEITVIMDDIENKKDWEKMPKGFANLIRQLIKVPDVANLLLQNYSQSTKTDKRIKEITLMGSFSAYFEYIASTKCFIPQFILTGTAEDWEKIYALPEKLINHLKLQDDLELEKPNGINLMHRWLSRLQPILQTMYLARTGKAEPEFWNNFYKYKSHSGGNTISGNIVYFYPFLSEQSPKKKEGVCSEKLSINDYILDKDVTLGQKDKYGYIKGPGSGRLSVNFISVDFKLEHLNVLYEMGITAGMVAYSETQRVLTPHANYSIFYKKDKPSNLNKLSKLNSDEFTGKKPNKNEELPQESVNKPKRKICFEMVIDDEPNNLLKPK
ncbi:MAG: DUF4419 domain-containing protein [Legionella longbeachae]|nr:DUF4419 domain-containing protein [Legionella longbeachae]